MRPLVLPTSRAKACLKQGPHQGHYAYTSRPRRVRVRVRASDQDDAGNQFSLAPSKPSTPFGQMAAYYLEMEPALFKSAIEDQFQRIKDEINKQEVEEQKPVAEDSMDLTISGLNNRVQQMRDSERRATVGDLMYMCVLESFMELGISMLPRSDNYTDLPAVSLQPLMDGVHTKEALDLVKEHMMSYMGPTSMLPTTTVIKMSKLQMLNVYASSIIFGYFLRRADQRFRLARAAGLLPEDKDDAVQKLERLFALDAASDGPDLVAEGDGSNESSHHAAANEEKKPLLKKYISSFDRATLVEMHRVMSREGRDLIDRQVTALWGDAKNLQEEMQTVIGVDASSVEELMQRADEAVIEDKVQTVTLTLSTQRRAVLEAIAFGTFVRDTELYVDSDFGLLTTNNDDGPGLLPSA